MNSYERARTALKATTDAELIQLAEAAHEDYGIGNPVWAEFLGKINAQDIKAIYLVVLMFEEIYQRYKQTR